MAWVKKKVVDKKPAFSGRKKNGERKQIGTKVKFEDGTSKVLLNPAGKGAKYAKELHERVYITNDGKVKANGDGAVIRVTDTQAAYRGGYLQAQKDQARAYTASMKKSKKK